MEFKRKTPPPASTDCFEIWYLLTGNVSIEDDNLFSVPLPENATISDFKRQVKKSEPIKSSSFIAADLIVYQNKAAYESSRVDGDIQALGDESMINGVTKENPLITVMSPPATFGNYPKSKDGQYCYQLFNSNGETFNNCCCGKVKVDPDADIVDFLEAVKSKNNEPDYLGKFPASSPRAYKNEASFKKRKDAGLGDEEPLGPRTKLENLNSNDTIYVVVPDNKSAKYQHMDNLQQTTTSYQSNSNLVYFHLFDVFGNLYDTDSPICASLSPETSIREFKKIIKKEYDELEYLKDTPVGRLLVYKDEKAFMYRNDVDEFLDGNTKLAGFGKTKEDALYVFVKSENSVHYCILDTRGERVGNAETFYPVTISSNSLILDFLKQVRAENSYQLDPFPMSRLKVYKNLKAFTSSFEPIPHNYKIRNFGQSTDDCLVVVVPLTHANLAVSNVINFWNAFKQDETPMEAKNVIRLPEDVYILGDQDIGSNIFIRDCYPDLLSIIMSVLKTENLVLMGNPGIGKTYFGYFLLWHFARQGQAVVYDSGATDKCFLFSNDGVFTGTIDHFRNYLDSKSTIYIVDAKKPFRYSARTILITSPERDIWYQFFKGNCSSRYMPVWTRDELICCANDLFKDLDEERVNQLYEIWGGVPRFALRHENDQDQQELVEHVILSTDLEKINLSIEKSSAPGDVSHQLIHLTVTEEFHRKSYCFASDYIANRVFQQYEESNRTKLISFLSASDGSKNALRGVFFERFAHQILVSGKSFKVRRLIENETTKSPTFEQSFGQMETIVFDSLNNVVFKRNTYYRPRDGNYPAIDAFISSNSMFQMTVTDTHPCGQAGIAKVLKMLNDGSTPKLYFVVPHRLFEKFKYQKYTDSNKKILNEPTLLDVQKVEQYVLSIDLTSDSTKQ